MHCIIFQSIFSGRLTMKNFSQSTKNAGLFFIPIWNLVETKCSYRVLALKMVFLLRFTKYSRGAKKYQNAFWLKGQQKEESKLSKQGLLISTTEISLHFGWMNALAPNLKIIEAQSSCVCEYAFNCFFFLSFGFVIILFLDASYKMWDAKQVVGWPPRKIRIIARPRQVRFFPCNSRVEISLLLFRVNFKSSVRKRAYVNCYTPFVRTPSFKLARWCFCREIPIQIINSFVCHQRSFD